MSRRCFLSILALVALLPCVLCQGEFPVVLNSLQLKPVSSENGGSLCGRTGSETYCAFSSDSTASFLPNCMEATCDNTCPNGDAFPSWLDLLSSASLPAQGESRPGSSDPSVEFTSGTSASVSESDSFQEGFSYAVWYRQSARSTGTLVSKSVDSNVVFAVQVNDSTVTFVHRNLQGSEVNRMTTGLSLPLNTWHHLIVTVDLQDFALLVNGSLVAAYSLGNALQDGNGSISLGVSQTGGDRFIGNMQDAYYFLEAITERDVQSLAGVQVSYVHFSPMCRCPPSHPRVDPADSTRCVQYPSNSGLVARGTARRVRDSAHPLGHINDGNLNSAWVSEVGNSTAVLTVDMGAVPYEVLFVLFRFGAPSPKAFVLEKSVDDGNTFVPFQYYADDCTSYFGLANNGPLPTPSSVNCITSGIVQTSQGSIIFRPIDPNTRPGTYHTNAELRDFLRATHLRFRFVDFFNTTTVGPDHLYYSIREAITSSRCDCNGHAARCNASRDTYQCLCVHNTAGTRCQECLPLYNNKPWLRGTTNQANECQMCQCNGHATSCHYNESVDPFPSDPLQGGGGVCDSCQDNTAGRHCEECARLYFRPSGKSPSDSDACEQCNCSLAGTIDDGDCVKSDSVPGSVTGQCSCKDNVVGIKCDTCVVGHFNLSSFNPVGCQLCSCTTAGSVSGSLLCDQSTGQCSCKQNVMGLSCDQCRPGFTNLTASNPEGCMSCGCHPIGSVDSTCDPLTGVCTCKPGVTGDKCDRCADGFFNFSPDGCQPCDCSALGSLSSVCNPVSGQCSCRTGVSGLNCSECADGFYSFSLGCINCSCNTAGTVNGSESCDKTSGQCVCKSNVRGLQCDRCAGGTALLEASNPDGCSHCPCFTPNTNTTAADNLCDQQTSQCYCNEGATGLLCESCVDGYFLTAEGCVACQCDPTNSVNNVCNATNGQCTCVHAGVGGLTCNACNPGFYQFPDCLECSCDVRGSTNLTCHLTTGVCSCKEFVEGDKCDRCREGYRFLEASNPSGCSAAPDEQGPPATTLIESTTVLLTWLPPERPNGAILYYTVYRNGSEVTNVTDTTYTDSGLEPFTAYTYTIAAVNRVGSTTSPGTVVRTSETAPEGIPPPSIVAVNATSLRVTWQVPSEPNGVVTGYALYISSVGGVDLNPPSNIYSGPRDQLAAVVSGLRPFTVYGIIVQACTSGGCGSGPPGLGTTEEAPPTSQPSPNATAVSSTTVLVAWIPPPEPNGIVTMYTVYQRNSPFVGGGFAVGNVSGSSSDLQLPVGELSAFTEYEFAIESRTSAGGTVSEWTRTRTGEDVPSGVQPPVVTTLSSTSLQINWTTPLTANGIITTYSVYMILPRQQLVVQSPTVDSYVLSGLQAFTDYTFVLEACTSVGCTTSSPVTQATMDDIPTGQGAATVSAITAEGVSISWDPPTSPNGAIQDYTVNRRSAALTSSDQVYERGVTFAGLTFARFTRTMSSTFSSSASLWFKTYDAEGTLVYGAASVGVDFLSVELVAGQPVFGYNCGSGSASISPNTTVTFNDGRWHYVEVSRTGRDGTIRVDSQYSGMGSSPGTDQIIGAFPSLFVGSRPDRDQDDAATFAGSVRSVNYDGQMLDFSQRDMIEEPTLAITTDGSLVNTENAIHFLGGSWLSTDSVFASSDSLSGFGLTVEFRTTDSNGVLLSASGDTESLELSVANGALVLTLQENNSTTTSTSSRTVCSGEWMEASIIMASGRIRTVVTNSAGTIDLLRPDLLATSITLNRNTYFGVTGGRESLGMALRQLEYNGEEVDLRSFWLDSRLVSFAWSPMGGNVTECNVEMESFTTTDTMLLDNRTEPFRTYIYRVGSRNNAGTSLGPWIGVRTLEGAPEGVMQVLVVSSDNTSISVTWTPPTHPNGIVLGYTVAASPVRPTWGEPSQLTANESVTVYLTEFSDGLSSVLQPLEPATVYSITLFANTSGGSSSGLPTEASTAEGIPSGVQLPLLSSSSAFSLFLTWDLPTRPNGAIMRYEVYVDGAFAVSSSQNRASIVGLTPFTNYTIFIRACTRVGCADGDSVIFSTPPDIPMGQGPPTLTILGSRSIEATWLPPTTPNGVITEYKLLLLSGPEQGRVTELYSGLDLHFVVTGLQPATEYFFAVESHNAGGSSRSFITIARTREDVPDGIDPPVLVDSNSTALSLAWVAPSQPNGRITRYILLIEMDNLTEIFNGIATMHTVIDLDPFTAYTFVLQACTRCSLCCGSSDPVTFTTMEAVPVGVSPPTILVVTPTSISFEVHPVSIPNGVVTYTVYIVGSFSDSNGNETGNSTTSVEMRMVYQDSEVGMGMSDNLLPFTQYELYLIVSNSAGQIASESVFTVTGESPPMGQAPPSIQLNVTALTATWTPPDQPNGNITRYALTVTSAENRVVVLRAATLERSITVTALRPFTEYSVTITSYNRAGSATSTAVNVRTGEVAPVDFDIPVLSDPTSTSLTVSWDPPGFPNSILQSYQVALNGTYGNLLSPSVTTHTITNLEPFTTYSVFVTVCNSVGCLDSASTIGMTSEALAEGVPAPTLQTSVSGEVIVSWALPEQPNGVILFYHIERASSPNDSPMRIGNTTARMFLDTAVRPFTPYWYRVVVVNAAGEAFGPYGNITTPEASPSSINPPTIRTLTATSLQIDWQTPSEPNGVVVEFVLKRMSGPQGSNVVIVANFNSTIFSYTDESLRPYTNYSYTITACTSSGCAESDPAVGQTAQALATGLVELMGVPVSSTAILLTWDTPSEPNGVIYQYILYREPADGSALDRVLLYRGLDTNFTDTGLQPYTFYMYKYQVENFAGTVNSDVTAPIRTLAAPPLSGPTLTADALNSTTVLAQWEPPLQNSTRGPILHYILTVTSQFDSVTITLNETTYRLTNLRPGTAYVIVVSLYNGAGTADSNSAEVVTAEGIPAGVQPPSVELLSPRAVNISWVLPLYPNGDITVYRVYINSGNVHNSTSVGSVQIMGLMPFTGYMAQLEACTQFGCGVSPLTTFTTPEDVPFGLATPTLVITGSTSATITWTPPTQPNGNITEYSVSRRTRVACLGADGTCSYVECLLSHSQCGSQCYSSAEKVCCDGVLFNIVEGHVCCGSSYLEGNSSVSQVCCGGQLHAVQANRQCCGGQYLHVPLGSVCCETGSGNPRIGMGTACCGGSPYTESANVVCCGGVLETNHVTRTCCGGQMVAVSTTTCCEGVPHALQAGYTCCGQQYVSPDTTLCCTVDDGNARVYTYESAQEKMAAREQCCDGSLIHESQSCCNGLGYNMSVSVCADRPTTATGSRQCGTGLTCPLLQQSSSFCNRCDFNAETTVCGVYTSSAMSSVTTGSGDEVCYQTDLVFNGRALEYTNTGLQPYTEYSYQIVAANSAGNVSSGFATGTTGQAAPSLVDPPLLAIQSSTSIFVHWSLPSMLNGEVASIRLYRENVEVLNTPSALSHLDTNLTAFTTYQYQLEVCTGGGCTRSGSSSATTTPATPTGLGDPVVTLNDDSISVSISWSPPVYPNGIISRYTIHETSVLGQVFSGVSLQTSVSDLMPFTNYTFVLTACNMVGCVSSNPVGIQAPEIPPTGVEPPTINILTSRSIDISWTPPTSPNGVIRGYILRRDNEVIYNDTGLMYRDDDLTPSTQYSYTIEAYNGGGGTESVRVIVHTPQDSPEGLLPPQLQVLSAEAIQATWSAPSQPNGRITSYSIIIDNIKTELGIVFEYNATELAAYTVYRFRVEACTASGCSRSTEVTAQTFEAAPSGVPAPTLRLLGPTAVEVSWQHPAFPNGVITSYEVTRLSGSSPVPSLQHFDVPSVLAFNNTGLTPFTSYQYRVRATNAAGSALGPYSTIQTPEDIPAGVGAPMVSAIMGTSVVVTWEVPTLPNGALLRYNLYLRLSVDPGTLGPGTPQLIATTPVNTTTTQVTMLIPATNYEVRVVAVNSAGEGESVWVPFETAEAAPDDLRPIRVVGKPSTGTALQLEWDPPLLPNGIITLYAVYVGGTEMYRGSVTSTTLMGLQPFTTYTLQLEACTSAGCTRGDEQMATTAEVAPAGQQPPTVTILSSTIVLIEWQAPLIPNGVISQYDVLRRTPGGSSSEGTTPAGDPIVVHSTTNVDSLAFNDTNLTPFTSYEYAIRAVNSAGAAQSVYVLVRTDPGAPTGLSAPVLTVVSSTSILVSCSEPTRPNGIITGYEVIRNDSVRFPVLSLTYTDNSLLPFTVYSYSIEVCTSAGCAESAPRVARTSEAVPTGLLAPLSTPLTSRSITVAWGAPTSPNGILTSFQITIQPDSIQVTHTDLENLLVNIGNLSPFTTYTVLLAACNSAGCSETTSTTVTTLEDIPELLGAPSLTVLSSSSIQASWQPPSQPNGVIRRYELRRNGTLVYSGVDTSHIDTILTPDTVYAYDVQAYTAAGGGNRSGASIMRTNQDTPTGILPPTLTPLSSSAIRATWSPPQMPNGMITQYRLFRNESEVFRGQDFEYDSTGLVPYTVYEFYLTVCTTTCGSSVRVSSRTQEAQPANMQRPVLSALPNVTILVMWSPPLAPNGIITSYRLARTSPPAAVIAEVFTGDTLMYLDNGPGLQPAREYQYSVTAVNSAGEVSSEFASVTTSEAVPEGVQAPVAGTITATSISLLIRMPTSPNGVITLYRVFRDNVMLAEVTPQTGAATTVYNAVSLNPFTTYAFYIEACNSAGCGRSPVGMFTTSESVPSSLSPPTAYVMGARSIFANWTAPAQPNGEIIRYTLWYRTSCPQPSQVSCTVGDLVIVAPTDNSRSRTHSSLSGSSDHPLPYTSYQFLLQAENSAGGVNSSFSEIVTTDTAAPEVIGQLLHEVTGPAVTIYWNGTFRLNGELRYYQVRREDIVVAEQTGTSATLPNQPTNTPLIYRVTVFTRVGNATSQPVTVVIPGVVVSTTTATATPSPSPSSTVTPPPPNILNPGIIVAIVIASCVVCIILTCLLVIVCMWLVSRNSKNKKRVDDAFAHQRLYESEMAEFHPVPYKTQGDQRYSGSWTDQEERYEVHENKRYASYSPPDAEKKYYRDLNVRDSYGTQSSSYTNPKAFYHQKEESSSDDFYEDGEPIACTFTDTRI